MTDYESEYNNRARVPEFEQIVAGWQRDAAAYRDSSNCELDVAYGLSGRLTYDMFVPADDRDHGKGAIALFIHGGYWQSMEPKFFSHMAAGLNGHGYRVAVAGYDLCPDVRIDDIIEELRLLCGHLWQHYRRPIVAYGHSAGGHLTASLLSTDWPLRGLPVRLVPAGYALSGLYDLLPLVRTSINDKLRMDEKDAIRLSPIAMSGPAGTKLIAAVGGEESREYFRQSRIIVDLWGRGGVDTRIHIEAAANHFTIIAPLADPTSDMVGDIVTMLAESG
jgi:arylformamidase